jgi:hypothetical protein
VAESDLLDFLAKNQQTLTWLGGGFATAAGGAWVAVKYLLDRRTSKESSDVPAAKGRRGSGTSVSAASGLAAGRDLHVGGDVSIRQDRLPKAGIVLAVIGLLLLGVAVMNAGHNVTVSNGSFVGGNVTNSHVSVTTTPPSDEKPKK